MKLNVLVIGITCYKKNELAELVNFLNQEMNLQKLPSTDEYLLVNILDWELEEVKQEMEAFNLKHSNPAWEIIYPDINSQDELSTLRFNIEKYSIH